MGGLIKLTLAVAVLIAASAAAYESDSVTAINKSNFQSEVQSSHLLWAVQFYTKDEASDKAAPIFEEVAAELSPYVQFGAVDCSVEVDLCSTMGVQTYPTMAFFGSPPQWNAFTKKNARGVTVPPTKHTKSAKALKKFCLRNMPQHVTEASDSSFENKLQEVMAKNQKAVIFFSDKDKRVSNLEHLSPYFFFHYLY